MVKNSTWIERFLSYLESERHFSPLTLKAYAVDLRQYEVWLYLEERGVLGAPSPLISRFIQSLNARYSSASTMRKTATLRSFYKWLWYRKKIQVNPMKLIRSPRLKRKLPKILSKDQVFKLMQSPDIRSMHGARDRAILELLYSTGLKAGELVALDRCDVSLVNSTLRIRSYTKEDRVVVLSLGETESLQRYLGQLDANRWLKKQVIANKEEALFINKNGGRLSDRSVRRKFDKYLYNAGLDMDISPRTLRHSFAAHKVKAGVPLKEVQQALGHRALSTTRVYAGLAAAS